MAKGYIYIMTNPSFSEYVKIGYANDAQKRLAELNSCTAVPFAFRVYATYEVETELSDKKLHYILDKLNPELRSAEEVDGKKRTREFYAMSPEDAYEILEAIAAINGHTDRLIKWKATKEEEADEKLAKEISADHRERMAPFSFDMVKLSTGAVLEYCNPGHPNDGTNCTVYDSKHVKYENEIYSLTALAIKLTDPSLKSIAGPRYFSYEGEMLNDMRWRIYGQ